MIVGERLTQRATTPKPDYCGLRLGLRGASPESNLCVKFNKRVLHDGRLGERLTTVNAGAPPKLSGNQLSPAAYAQFPVEDLDVLLQGVNSIEIAGTSSPGEGEITIVETQLGVLYTRSLADLMFEEDHR